MCIRDSFTGEDSFDVAVIAGNAGGDAVGTVMGGDSTTNEALALDGVAYTYPLGGFTLNVGDGNGADALFSGACAYSAFTDTISDCGTSNVGGTADSGVAVSYDFGNGFVSAGGIAGGNDATADA